MRSTVATATFFLTGVGTVHYLNPQISIPPASNTTFDPILAMLLQILFVLYHYNIPDITPNKYYQSVSSFVIVVQFAFGIALAGMLQQSKIQSFRFLPFDQRFDPTLFFVAVGGLVPLTLACVIKLRWTEKPLFNVKFNLPRRSEIDLKFNVGAAIFGIGCGAIGIFPGPGLVNIGAMLEDNRSMDNGYDRWEAAGLELTGDELGYSGKGSFRKEMHKII